MTTIRIIRRIKWTKYQIYPSSPDSGLKRNAPYAIKYIFMFGTTSQKPVRKKNASTTKETGKIRLVQLFINI